MQSKPREGFTLYELLIVVVIVGLLATAAVTTNGKALERARVNEAQVMLNMIYRAERLYRIDQGTYGDLASPGLIGANYVDGNPTNQRWTFTIEGGSLGINTFTARATRQGTGPVYNNKTIRLDQTFTGAPQGTGIYLDPGPPSVNKTYGGDHKLRD